jgi:hypothetical protein
MKTNRITDWTIGSDFEVFIKDVPNNKLISAAGDVTTSFKPLIPGTKENPYYIDDERKKAIEVDNVSAELLIKETNNKEEFLSQIRYMLAYLKDNLHAGYEPALLASARFDIDQLLAPSTQIFGCDRDRNAWTRTFNPRPDNNTNLRSNGFHIHVGYKNPTMRTSIELIKALDYYVGLGSVAIDTDTDRRTLYGKAGSFRLKPYGVEYRTLSSALLQHDAWINWVFDGVVKAIEFVNEGHNIPTAFGKQLVEAINTNNVKLASSLSLTKTNQILETV